MPGVLREEIVIRLGPEAVPRLRRDLYCLPKELSHPPRPPGDQPDVVRRVMILDQRWRRQSLQSHARGSHRNGSALQRGSSIPSAPARNGFSSPDQPDKSANRKTHLTEGDKILQDVGGRDRRTRFLPYHVDDLDQSFQDIGDELRNHTPSHISPTTISWTASITASASMVPDHKGYQVRARRGYFAKANSGTGTNPSGFGKLAAASVSGKRVL